jgi:tetratricopeptide (TPR) repeat protein
MSTTAHNSKGKIDVIIPEKVYGRDDAVYQARPRSNNLLKVLLLLLALVLLLVGGGLLLVYLSKNPVQMAGVPDEGVKSKPGIDKSTTETPKQKVAPTAGEKANPTQIALEKEEAEKRLTDFLSARKALDGIGGAEWGGELYAKMLQRNQEADGLFMNQAYASASQKYLEALSMVGKLAGQSEEALHRVLEEGSLALTEGDGKRAVNKFNVALKIDPGNEFATRSLERAKKTESVTRLIESGKGHEQRKALSLALTDYREAQRLDPQSKRAQMAFNRVKAMIAQDQFQQLMSSGFSALHAEDYDAARAAFLKARSFKPNSNEVQDALAQVDQAIRMSRIEALREKALAAEKNEDWGKALESYQATLEIDNSVQFAVRGEARAQERVRIEKHMAFYLEKPKVLESDPHLANGIELLQEASKIEPKGPRLAGQIEKLDQLVKIAKTPMRVTLESDNLTEVAVYKVGRLGKFHTRDLNLRPGTYTVVGTRDGYKDVRQKMVVKPGEEGLRITLKCEERI